MRYLSVVIILFLLNSCQKNEYAMGTIIKEGPTYETGPVLPELRNVQNDTAIVVLYPNARVFYLDMKMKKSELYTKMIQSAEKNNLPVRARIFERTANPGGEEISEIYPPTAKDIENFKASMHP